MSVVNKPYTFSANSTISSSEVNADLDVLYNEINGSLSAANIASNAITTAKIADSNVTTAKVADSAITTAKINDGAVTNTKLATGAGEPGGAWQSWTPTLSGITLGSGTVVAKYTQIGKTVHFSFVFTFGAGSAMSTGTFSAPVTAKDSPEPYFHIGQAYFNDLNNVDYPGYCRLESTTTIRPVWASPIASLSSTSPFTWATGDYLTCVGTYEAA